MHFNVRLIMPHTSILPEHNPSLVIQCYMKSTDIHIVICGTCLLGLDFVSDVKEVLAVA